MIARCAFLRGGKTLGWAAVGLALMAASPSASAPIGDPNTAPTSPLALAAEDVIPTGNDWIALPSIRARDGALQDFNVISMRYRGLLEVAGTPVRPLMVPNLTVNGKPCALTRWTWTLQSDWVPTGTQEACGVRLKLTYAAPPDSRAAVIRIEVANLTGAPVHVAPGMDVNWAQTHRVTYSPEPLKGDRTMTPTPIDSDMEIFSYGTDDAHFAWGFAYVGSRADLRQDAAGLGLTAQHPADLAPGQTLDLHFLIGVGLEEYSAAYAMRVLNKKIDRYGMDGVIAQTVAEARRHTRTTGQADLDRIMNRNLLFTTYYAWGRALDTEQFVGMTSRSNRYYVSAAYWDRDALLWSFPALLDTDPDRAREALDYVLGLQARNIGVHSRFIDGVVLEDGFELDELVAPILALKAYQDATGDTAMFARHSEVIAALQKRLQAARDPGTGLYETFQDAQDEYIKKPFSVSDNVLTWRALKDLAALEQGRGQAGAASRLTDEAARLKAAILRYGVIDGAEGAGGPIFAANVNATGGDFIDVPPGSLMKLPYLGFIDQNDPLFRRTYDWLHSAHHPYSFADKPFGLPGSYRLPFTTSWVVADHLRLTAGRDQALNILRNSPWDGGVITEGVSPATGTPDHQGLAFATAAGYVGHTICEQFCIDRR